MERLEGIYKRFEGLKPLSGSALKMIALITMIIDHIGSVKSGTVCQRADRQYRLTRYNALLYSQEDREACISDILLSYYRGLFAYP